MFLRVCVCPQGGEYVGRYTPRQVHPPGWYTPSPWQIHPPADTPQQVHPLAGTSPPEVHPQSSACWEIRATSGRYASYLNAFLSFHDFKIHNSKIANGNTLRVSRKCYPEIVDSTIYEAMKHLSNSAQNNNSFRDASWRTFYVTIEISLWRHW